MHIDAAEAGERVVLMDDLLATGGYGGRCVSLIERIAGASSSRCSSSSWPS